jgi:hypothetical protein
LNALLYPETLENSSVLNILVDSNLNFKINDLLNLKQISCKNKSELLELLTQIPFINISGDKESAIININDNLVVFSFINIPQKLAKSEVLFKLGFDSENDESILRFYKKSLLWNLVVLKDKVDLYERNFKKINFSDGNLKYELINKNQMIKNINKQIQILNYQKETQNLQVDSDKNSERSIKENYNMDRTNSGVFSWRKKSRQGNLNTTEK